MVKVTKLFGLLILSLFIFLVLFLVITLIFKRNSIRPHPTFTSCESYGGICTTDCKSLNGTYYEYDLQRDVYVVLDCAENQLCCVSLPEPE